MGVGEGREAPLVSFIMPVYEPEPAWLEAAVAGVLAEPGPALELIVVDDGSEVPAETHLERFSGDPRLRLIRVPHGRVARARNRGLEEVRGRWIRYVDGDDLIVAGSTGRLLELAGGREDVLPYGATMLCDGELNRKRLLSCGLEGFCAEEAVLARFTTRIPAILFPRAIAERTGEWDPAFPVAPDWDYVVRAMEIAPIRGSREVTYLYRRHGGGITGDVEGGRRGAEMVVARYLERNPGRRRAIERRGRAMVLAQSGRTLAARGHPIAATRPLARSIAIDPREAAFQAYMGAASVLTARQQRA